MKSLKSKTIALLSILIILSATLTGCLSDPEWMAPSETAEPTSAEESSDLPVETAAETAAASPSASESETLSPTDTPTPTATPTPVPTSTPIPTPPAITDLPADDLGAANYTEASDQIAYISANLGSSQPMVEEYCAYIAGKSMAMDGQTDIEFNYVEWLSDPEATAAYLEDYPGASPEDYEFIEQIGYIRDVDPATEWYRTSDDTRYFLNRPLYTSQIGEVDYDEFRDWLFPLTGDAFVIVCVVDGVIARVEWIYMP